VEKDTNNLCIILESATKCVADYVAAALAAEKAMILVERSLPDNLVLTDEVVDSLRVLNRHCLKALHSPTTWIWIPAARLQTYDSARRAHLRKTGQPPKALLNKTEMRAYRKKMRGD